MVVAYGLLLPRAVLALPRLGCLNIHGSLLPRWRGAAPIQRAILAGDAQSGVTIMQMDEGLDTGPTLLAEPVVISRAHTAGSLHDELSVLGARLLIEALTGLERGTLTAVEQPADGVTYAPKIDKREAPIDWAPGRPGDRAPGARLQPLADRPDAAGGGGRCGSTRPTPRNRPQMMPTCR